MSIVRLIAADAIRPSTYNPREANPERLDLVELSLRKLGWMLPIYADANGEILSGHQRHYVSTERLGYDKLPVVYTEAFDLEKRKALNIAFNRGTNDMESNVTSLDVTEEIKRSGVLELCEDIPDALTDDERYPILSMHSAPLAPILSANKGRWSRHAKNVARALYRRGIAMPIVLDGEGQVINGIGRLEYFAFKGRSTADVLIVDDPAKARVTKIMLNLLTMDFDLHRRYADELRYNSFRRTKDTRTYMGRGFTFATIGSNPAWKFDVTKPAHGAAWRKVHGDKVLDFGAGDLTESKLLRKAGIEVTSFEPFHCPIGEGEIKDTLRPDMSRAMGRGLIEKIASGYAWDSVFLSSVLNSVPFEADRHHVLTILSALCVGTDATAYIWTKSTDDSSWRIANTSKAMLNHTSDVQSSFTIPYEPNTTLTEFAAIPKAQKFHTNEEFADLVNAHWSTAKLGHLQANCWGILTDPRPVIAEQLAAACEHEFNLAYPDGSRMGLADAARTAFSTRLGMTI